MRLDVPAGHTHRPAGCGRGLGPGLVRAGRRMQQQHPAYCTDAANLKTSVSDLGNVDVAKNGLSSLQTALNSVTSNANMFAADAKSAFAPQTTALQNSLSSLQHRDHVREEPAFRDRGHGGRVIGHASQKLGKRAAKCRISIREMLANKCPASAPGSGQKEPTMSVQTAGAPPRQVLRYQLDTGLGG